MVRFRVETILLDGGLDLPGEREFLEGVVGYFRAGGADVIIPGTTNAIFRTYPQGAIAAPYGTYFVDLQKSEEQLWSAVHSKNRQDIRNATKRGVTVKVGMEYRDLAYALIRDTFRRSRLPFMNGETFQRIVTGVSDHVKILVAEYEGVTQYSVVVFYSSYSAYAVYGGSILKPVDGATKMLHWHAMRLFRDLGVRRYDLVGSRITPDKGSKAENLMLYKLRLGAVLSQGYMWKYVLRPVKSAVYSVAVRLLRGGDIVDNERHKLIELEMTSREESGHWRVQGT
jgi:lipid II:glycine glycyltransferase (peptidoglycan interpeptide bridge formation enzyme)